MASTSKSGTLSKSIAQTAPHSVFANTGEWRVPQPMVAGAFSAEQLMPGSTSFAPNYEAAILFAANYYEAARDTLVAYLKTPEGKNNLKCWLMLFDLYQMIHDQHQFDELSLMFTVKFERSPPVWRGLTSRADPRRKEKRARADLFALTETNAADMPQTAEAIIRLATEAGSIRLDFTKLNVIDVQGAETLAQSLRQIRQAATPIWFTAGDKMMEWLRSRISSLAPAQATGYWSLLFEMYILEGKLEAYEELGLEYAVAFEQSPPAWETVKSKAAQSQEQATTAVAAEVASDGYAIEGVLSGNKEALQSLVAYASAHKEVVIDLAGLMRVDFHAAGPFVETIRAIHLSQKRVVLSNINELVAAFLEVFNITKYAVLIRRKMV